MDAMSQNNWSDKFTAFAIGAGVGALLALFLAPASGEETRENISDTVRQSIDEAAATGKRWKRRAQETVDDVKDNVTDAVEAGGKAYRVARDT
jgi:gas vesicle protein